MTMVSLGFSVLSMQYVPCKLTEKECLSFEYLDLKSNTTEFNSTAFNEFWGDGPRAFFSLSHKAAGYCLMLMLIPSLMVFVELMKETKKKEHSALIFLFCCAVSTNFGSGWFIIQMVELALVPK